VTAAVAVAGVTVPTTLALRDRTPEPTTATGPTATGPTATGPTATGPTATGPTATATIPAPARIRCSGDPAPRTPVPGLPAQTGVLGSLGGDPAAVDAALRTGWSVLGRVRDSRGPLDPATAVVRMVQRTDDGLIVASVGATGKGAKAAVGADVLVAGPDLAHLYAADTTTGFGGAGRRVLPPGMMISRAYLCQPDQLVVLAPPGSTGRVSWIAGIGPDLTLDQPHVDIPFRSDGVAVFTRPAPTETVTIRVEKDGRTLADTWYTIQTGPRPVAPSPAAIGAALARAPGDGTPAQALAVLRQQFTQVPVDQSDLSVLWTGTTPAGWTVAAAVTTLPGGAHYVWGGAVSASDRTQGIRYFDGLLAADQLDRTALVVRFPGPRSPVAVLFAGTRTVQLEHGAPTAGKQVAGGVIDEDGAGVTKIRVLDDAGQELTVVEAKKLTALPSPMN
jgi:hypothetical protein